MGIIDTLREATESARELVLDNIERASVKTGKRNPFGDQTLALDKETEDIVINVLQESDTTFSIMTEEQGIVEQDNQPDYIAIVDPIDGSANLERGIPFCSIGISVLPYGESLTTDDLEVSIIQSYFTNETYVARKGKGVTLNGKQIRPREKSPIAETIISYDTKKQWDEEFSAASLRVLKNVFDMRRSASNLLDLCWTAAGGLDAMLDLRGVLPIVHVSGTHMVTEAGGFVIDFQGSRLKLPIDYDERMSFVAASNEILARNLLALWQGTKS
ncbi:MAG: inositol monophosphatase family protein [Promethearchaeia archaeon]